jgi:hypothetical protein
LLAAVAVALAAGSVPNATGHRQEVNPHARILQEFRKRVDGYIELREKARSGMPGLKETSEPAEITRREKALGRAVRAARSGAKQGEIFTPDISRVIRETIRANFIERDPKERRAALDGLPDKPLGVNEAYPSTLPLATVPPTLLRQLPQLPDTLEYRLIGDQLILRDVNTNLVVDFVPNAVPKPGV